MRFKLKQLTLQCRKSREVLDLSHHVLFFHGKVGSGKSSIARLIDFCLGGEVEKTPAIKQELLSATLEATIGDYEVLLERATTESTTQVSWIEPNGLKNMVSAPKDAGIKPIWEDSLYNLSDLIFYFLNIPPIKIHRNRNDDSPLVRLSFRNFMWFCYLEQAHLDSSFYKQEDTIKRRSSKEVIRYVLQYLTQEINNLEIELAQKREDRNIKLETSKELRAFLQRFGYSTVGHIEKEINDTESKLSLLKEKRKKLDEEYAKNTHPSDKLRDDIRNIAIVIIDKEDAVVELAKRVEEQETVKAELISSKFKLARTESAKNIFSGVRFIQCPACGDKITRPTLQGECYLCSSNHTDPHPLPDGEVVRIDLDNRIKEVDDAIGLHTEAVVRLKRETTLLKERKKLLDRKLSDALNVYESAFLANARETDRQIATLQERVRGQNKLKEMPKEITRIENFASVLLSDMDKLKRKIAEEKAKLTESEAYVQELEIFFKETLLKIGLPGVAESDVVKIDRTTWEVKIYPNNQEYLEWDFYNTGSGGKKTLFNVCFMIAFHAVAAKNDLPLPSFMIIDTPMKNIDNEVNADVFTNFYNYLFELSQTLLSDTQIIIIDNKVIMPTTDEIDFYERKMTPDDPDYPPLIPYYKGS